MTDPQIDMLLASLSARSDAAIDSEQAVWTKIAQHSFQGHGGRTSSVAAPVFHWRLSLATVAVAGSVGFLGATLMPPATATGTALATGTQNVASWILPDASLAPSTL